MDINNDKFSSILLFVLHHDIVSPGSLVEKFRFAEDDIDDIIAELVDYGVITHIPHAGENYAVIDQFDNLDTELVELLNDAGIKDQMIKDIIDGKYTEQREASQIVDPDPDKWTKFDPNEPVDAGKMIIRIKDPTHIYFNARDTIVYAEDQRLAEYKDGKWVISGPYPKYEYSPLIGKDHQILPGMVVTHYRLATPKEIDTYYSRFDLSHHYSQLVFKVDSKNEESMYDALTIALRSIAYTMKSSADDKARDKFSKAYLRIMDIQNLMDSGKEIGDVENG